MNKPSRRIALLVELPAGMENEQLASIRRFLKTLTRNYNIKLLSLLPPAETITFGDKATQAERADTVDGQAAATKPSDESEADAKPAGTAKPTKPRKRFPNPNKGPTAL